MTKCFNKFEKSCFWPIFDPFGPFSQIFGLQNVFQRIRLSRTISYEYVAPCKNLEKTNDTTPRNCLDRGTGGRTDKP